MCLRPWSLITQSATSASSAARADGRLVAVRQLRHELMDIGEPCGFLDLLGAGTGPSIGDIVADAVVEQHRVLRHHADGAAEALLRDIADVLAVDEDPALVHV